MRGKGDVDGVYRLLEEATEKRDEVCVDGCVYAKVTFLILQLSELRKIIEW